MNVFFSLIDDEFQNPIIKNTCLGEYTGELITHREAEKRGKLYDRINNSYLFNVNDKVSVSYQMHLCMF